MSQKRLNFKPSGLAWILGLLILYLPIVTLIMYSFLPQSGQGGRFERVTLDAYRLLLENNDILEALYSSLSIAVSSATISVLIGGACAFGMRRSNHWITRVIPALTVAPLVLPEVVFGLGLLMWFVILRISLGSISLVVAHVTFSVSYVFLTVNERVRLLDPALDDAASDLGASPLQTFIRIHLPLLAPSLVAGWFMAFTLSFDDFLISFFTSGPETTTLPLTLYGMIKYGVSPVVFAMATVVFGFSFISVSIIHRWGGGAKFNKNSA